MPRIDPGMQSGRILQWLKAEGSEVRKGEALALVEGEKATFELEAPFAGVLRKQLVSAEADVPVGRALALIGGADELLPAGSVILDQAAPAPAGPTGAVQPVTTPTPGELEEEARVKISPSARRLAREHGIEYTALKGTGPGGRIVSEDVLAAVEARKTAPARTTLAVTPGPTASEEIPGVKTAQVIPLTGRRRMIAERLGHSFRTTVPVLLTMEADMEGILNIRDVFKRATGPDITVTAFTVRAAAKALEKHPNLNSMLEGDAIRLLGDIHVGVAIDAPAGLVAPVIRDANKKPVQEISREITTLAEKAQHGHFTPEEVTGATFTVTNLGAFEVDAFAPVINPPNAAILGVGRVTRKPVVVEERIQPKAVMTLSLVFDHRIVDGAPAARFLQEVKQLLENPVLLFA